MTTTETLDPPGASAPDADRPRRYALLRSPGDRVFRGLAVAAGFTTMVLMGLIFVFLFLDSRLALETAGWSFFTEFSWSPDAPEPTFGIPAVLYWTVIIASIALVIAVPIAIGTALFINEYAPRAVRRPITSLVDLLAAVPSLIYGLWGFFFLQPELVGVSRWLSDAFGSAGSDGPLFFAEPYWWKLVAVLALTVLVLARTGEQRMRPRRWALGLGVGFAVGAFLSGLIPIFEVASGRFDSSAFVAGVVVSLMVIPITTSVVREVFSQAPPGEKEAALALGGSRWGMIRTVVLPFGRGGIIGGSMLGLGRALGETIAVAIIISPLFEIRPNLLETGAGSVAQLIATKFGEAGEVGRSALSAAGLTLFVLTLIVNTIATFIVARSRSGAEVEI